MDRHFFEGCVTENGERRGSALVGKAAAKFFEFFEKRFVVGDLGRKGTLAPRPFLPVFWQFSSERVNEIFLKLFYLLLFHWLLCTVIAHASRSGICVIFARTLPFSSIAHSAGVAVTLPPECVLMMGNFVSSSKSTTVPRVPFTYSPVTLFLVNMTAAPRFNSSRSGERQPRFK